MLRRRARVTAVALMMACLAAPSAARAQPLPPDASDPGVRVRFAVEGGIGGTAGPRGAIGGSTVIAAGVQLGDLFAIYGQTQLLVARGLMRPGDGAVGAVMQSLVLDLTIADVLQIGAGPSLDFGLARLCGANVLGCADVSGPYAGVEGRLALALGERNAARRRGLVVAGHVHTTWLERSSTLWTMTLTAGFEMD